MVWIHGGGFVLGSGNGDTDFYGPAYLLDRDIVLVTINYRLGPFGGWKTVIIFHTYHELISNVSRIYQHGRCRGARKLRSFRSEHGAKV